MKTALCCIEIMNTSIFGGFLQKKVRNTVFILHIFKDCDSVC